MVARCFFTVSSLMPNSRGNLPIAEAAGDRVRHLALALGQRFHVQGTVGDHGFLLRSGAQLPPYFLKRGTLENRTPPGPRPPIRRRPRRSSCSSACALGIPLRLTA